MLDGETAFFPPKTCTHGKGATIFYPRLCIAATTAPAGIMISVVFEILFLSQFVGVEFAKQVTAVKQIRFVCA